MFVNMYVVRGGVFHLLGTLCELYPEHMAAYSMKLPDIYLKTLKDEVCATGDDPTPVLGLEYGPL